jgi:hypothetical protein
MVEGKTAGREADHLPPASAEVKKMCIYTFTPHMPSWCRAKLVEHRDNFALTIIGASEALRVMITDALVFRSIQRTNILLRCWFKPLISFLELNEKKTYSVDLVVRGSFFWGQGVNDA